ncbi:MAG TPA: extracellular solute-binding protein [Pseudonocardia sp.]|nr:extracellular solute-binding protein [Pseudonocardia sp.]
MSGTLRFVSVAAAAALVLTACGFGGGQGASGGGGGQAAGTTQLSLLVPSYSDGTKGRWEKIISDFQAANPDVQVALEVQSWDNINDVVRTKVQANQAPDILNIDAYSGFAQDDLLYPATEIASPETIADLQPSFVQNATLGDTQQAMPLIASTRTLFYNTDLFAQAGIAAPPKTWAELQAAAEKIQALSLPDTYGYGMPLGSEEAQAETSIWTFGAGGTWGDASNLTIDTPQNLEGLQGMKQLIDAKVTQPDPGATDRTPLINVFIQGKLGMIEGLPPTVGQIKEKNPGLTYATAPIPTKDGKPVTLGVADHLMAFKNNGDKAEAIKKFVDYFYSQPVYTGWVEAEGFLPVTKSGATALASKPELKTFLDGLPTAKFYPAANQKWSATQGALQSLVGQIGQGTDPAAVLQQVQTAAETG